MVRLRGHNQPVSFRTGRVNGNRAKPAPKPRPRRGIDPDALAETLARFEAERLEAEAAERRKAAERDAAGDQLAEPERLANGTCHTCGRQVTGERRYCGPCLAKRL